MTSNGIGAVYVETHNWGATAKFFQGLGYALDFETDHNSGMFRNGDGPFVFVAEIPADRTPTRQIVLNVADTSYVEVESPFEPTHYGTREATVRDPDGREWTLSAPA